MRSVLIAMTAALGLCAAAADASTIIAAGTSGTTGASAYYLTDLSEISSETPLETSILQSFLGAPDAVYTGLNGQYVTYDLGAYRLTDQAGGDFNVYETGVGNVPEFNLLQVLVSADGTNFFDITDTLSAALDLAGDEDNGSANNRHAYDVSGAVAALGVSEFRYVRLNGTVASNGAPTGTTGFDLDSLGIASFAAVPEPASWAMMLAGFGVVGAALRVRRRPILA